MSLARERERITKCWSVRVSLKTLVEECSEVDVESKTSGEQGYKEDKLVRRDEHRLKVSEEEGREH